MGKVAAGVFVSALILVGSARAQTFTVINQAHVRPVALAKVERAVIAQSVQLHAAWGTPTASFGPGGWKLYLKVGQPGEGGVHFWDGSPYVLVYTHANPYGGWSALFSHEVVETLENPVGVTYNVNGVGYQLEVADPAEGHDYRLRGVWVADFVLRAWYAGARLGGCSTTLTGEECDGPLISALGNPGPWDQARALRGAWQGA